jgi:hypothetical protein
MIEKHVAFRLHQKALTEIPYWNGKKYLQQEDKFLPYAPTPAGIFTG